MHVSPTEHVFMQAIILAFFATYTTLAMIAMEKIEFKKGGYTSYAYKAKHGHAFPDITTNNNAVSPADPGQMDALNLESSTLAWRNVRYTVSAQETEVKPLDNVGEFVKPGQLTALMGSSGAGKTTLLHALARRKTLGKLEGDVRVDGEPQTDGFKRI